jgi:hypothetical protein
MIIALILILGGGFFAYLVQTSGGDIEIRNVRFMGSNNTMMSALFAPPCGANMRVNPPRLGRPIGSLRYAARTNRSTQQISPDNWGASAP